MFLQVVGYIQGLNAAVGAGCGPQWVLSRLMNTGAQETSVRRETVHSQACIVHKVLGWGWTIAGEEGREKSKSV